MIGIGGSPRHGGNSDLLLDSCLAGARDAGAVTGKIVLNDLCFAPCQECEKINDDGTCRIEDGMSGVYRAVDEARIIVLATPIFFGSVSAQVKMMVDRFQCLWVHRLKAGAAADRSRKGVLIAAEATRRDDFFANARSVVRNFFATVDAEYAGELFCPGLEGKGAVSEHPEFLERARKIGRAVVEKR